MPLCQKSRNIIADLDLWKLISSQPVLGMKAFVNLVLSLAPLLIVGTWFSYKLTLIAAPHLGPIGVFFNGNKPKLPYFIFECKKGQICGGLADRQKGIVTSYIISQILNTSFGIDVDKPCSLTNYLVPNQVDWIVPSDVSEMKNRTLWDRTGRSSPALELTFPNITSKVKNDVIIYRGNIDRVPVLMNNPLYKNLEWTRGLGYLDLYKNVYDKLFKLSYSTQKKLDEFLNIVGKDKLFCMHLRMGENADMPSDDPRPNSSPDLDVVVDFLERLTNQEGSYRVFVATDSSSVKDRIHKIFGSRIIDIKGKIAHMDIESRCEEVEKGILDQKVLSLCDTLIMSVSGFSRMAALMRGSDDNLYQVIQDKITRVTRLTPSVYGEPR